MDTKMPYVSKKANEKQKENAQKCLDIILNYSKNANKQKDYVAHPQTMLKDDLKRDFGCRTTNIKGINREVIAKRLGEEQCQSFQSIKSNEINDFINKYICVDGSNDNSKTNNIITLDPNEVVRLKAGGSLLSVFSKPNADQNNATTASCCTKKKKSNKRSNKYYIDKNIAPTESSEPLKIRIKENLENNESSGLNESAVKRCINALVSDQIDKTDNNRPNVVRFLDSLVSEKIDRSDMDNPGASHFKESIPSNVKNGNENKEPAVSSFLKSFVSDKIENSEEKHITFADETPLFTITDDDVNTSDASEVDSSTSDEKITPTRATKSNLTVLEFDRIFNEEVKRRRGRDASSDLTHPSLKVKTTNNTRVEPSSSVKTALIHSAVTGLPNDIPFNEDFELMNAIDKFIQADNACKFEEALKAAEYAAKAAPAGFEEEAAASAARNYQFQCDQRDNFNSILLDEKKKPIEIVAYVGCTNNSKNVSCSDSGLGINKCRAPKKC